MNKADIVDINDNLPLAYKMAHRFARGDPDAMQSAVVGLIEGAQRYRPERGRFSTYVTPWIIKRICREMSGRTSLAIPSFMCDARGEILAALDAADARPTHTRYREGARILRSRFADSDGYRARRLSSISPCALQAFDQAMTPAVSLHAMTSDITANEPSVEDVIIAAETRRALRDALAALDDFHRDVLVRLVVRRQSMREVAREMGRSLHDIRKARQSALEAMRTQLAGWHDREEDA